MIKLTLIIGVIFLSSSYCFSQKNIKSKHDYVYYYRPALVNVKFSKTLYWVVKEKEKISKGYPIDRKYVSGQPSGSYNNPYASVGVLGAVKGFQKPINYYIIERKSMPDTVSNILVNIGTLDINSKKDVAKIVKSKSEDKPEVKNYSYDFEFSLNMDLTIQTKKWVPVDNNPKIVKTIDTILFAKKENINDSIYKFNFPNDLDGSIFKTKQALDSYYNKHKNTFFLKIKTKIFNYFLLRCKREFVSKYIPWKNGFTEAYVFKIKDKNNEFSEVNELANDFSKLVEILGKNMELHNRLNWYVPEADVIISRLLNSYSELANSKDQKFTYKNIYCMKRNRILMLFFDSQFELAIKEIDEIFEEQRIFKEKSLDKIYSKKERKVYNQKYRFISYDLNLDELRLLIVDYQKRYDVFKGVYHWVK